MYPDRAGALPRVALFVVSTKHTNKRAKFNVAESMIGRGTVCLLYEQNISNACSRFRS